MTFTPVLGSSKKALVMRSGLVQPGKSSSAVWIVV
jgi:hypothetical protein